MKQSLIELVEENFKIAQGARAEFFLCFYEKCGNKFRKIGRILGKIMCISLNSQRLKTNTSHTMGGISERVQLLSGFCNKVLHSSTATSHQDAAAMAP